MIQLQRLEGFYWVARTEGYARAARAFPYPITQPGVHQQVHKLEQELGVTLFRRVGKDRVALTSQGRALFAHVAPFIEGLSVVEQAIRGGTHGGTLRIHAAALALRQLVPSWVRRLASTRPDVTVALHPLPRLDLSLLRNGQADLLVDHAPDLPADLEARELAQMRPFVVAPPRLLGGKRRVSLSALQDAPFVAYDESQSGRQLQLLALRQAQVRVGQIHSADSAETILGIVAAGLGFSIVPSLSPSGPKLGGVVAWPLEAKGVRFPIHAVWRRAPVQDPLVTAALAALP